VAPALTPALSFRRNNFDLEQELGPHELRHDQKHGGGTGVAEEASSHLFVSRDVFGAGEVC
jgi:hypothetical protein